MNPFVLAGGGYGDRALLPGKHPQEAFLEIEGPGHRQGSRAIRGMGLGIRQT